MNLFLLQVTTLGSYFKSMRKFVAKKLIVFSLFTLQVGVAFADQTSPWEKAIDLANEKKYEQALQLFLSQPPAIYNPDYFYNLGTLYYQSGHVGVAVAYLEKAHHLQPYDSDLNFNRSLARSTFVSLFGNEKLDPTANWLQQIADELSFEAVRTALGFLGLIVVTLWIRAYWTTRSIKKGMHTPSGLWGTVGLIILIGVYSLKKWAELTPYAVCIHPQSVESGPGENFVELSRMTEGTKVRILEAAGDEKSGIWQQIQFSSSGIGWVKASSLLTL